MIKIRGPKLQLSIHVIVRKLNLRKKKIKKKYITLVYGNINSGLQALYDFDHFGVSLEIFMNF